MKVLPVEKRIKQRETFHTRIRRMAESPLRGRERPVFAGRVGCRMSLPGPDIGMDAYSDAGRLVRGNDFRPAL